jgi:hypothetical protein
MLQKLAQHIAYTYTRAAEWEERAREATDRRVKADSLRIARTWKHLAESYEFVQALEAFLMDAHKQSWSPILPKSPKQDD